VHKALVITDQISCIFSTLHSCNFCTLHHH